MNSQDSGTLDSIVASPPALPSTLPNAREKLLDAVRKQSPGLLVEDAFEVPAWFCQQRQWFDDPAGSDSFIYNFPLLLRIRGPLNETALEQSLREIVRRHGVLRSVFRVIDGKLVQIVLAPEEFKLQVTTVDGLPETREQQVQEAVRAEADRPFDLARGPIFRAGLMRLQPDHFILQLTSHSLVFDDWSSGILIRELSETYGAFAAGTTPPAREIPFQYGDFIRWQWERLEDAELEPHLDFWRAQLDSRADYQHLSADFERPARNTNEGATLTTILPAALAESLKVLSRAERVSLFMVLLAGFKCLLHRCSGHEEIVVASCVANRSLLEVEGLVGRFGNSTLYRTSFAGDPTFSELLRRVLEVTFNASPHQEVPFAMLLDEIAGESDSNRPLPFQVMFVLQNAPKESLKLPGLTVDFAELNTGTSKYDLIVWLKSEPALEITLEYSTQVFASERMKKIVADYQAILETMVKNPKQRVSDLRLAPKSEPVAAAGPTPATANKSVGAIDKAGVEARMVELWESLFGIRPIGVTQDFFQLGGDSLLAVRMMAQIRKTFQRTLPLTVLLDAPTIRQLVQILCNGASTSLSSIVRVQPKGTRPPLFCVHGHGGEPFYCWELSRALGADQPVYGLRSQGFCGGPILNSVPEMAANYVRAIRDVAPTGPYLLGGYCVGGMIAYEMARILKEQGQEVELVALFNTPSAGSLRGWPLNIRYLKSRVPYELRKLCSGGIIQVIPRLSVKSLGLARHTLGTAKAALWSACGKSSPGAERWAHGLLNIPDANVVAAKSYDARNYPGRVTLFMTREIAKFYGTDPCEGWLPLAAGGLECHTVEGDNDTMFDPRFDAMLVKELKRCIERASAHSRESDSTGN